EFLQVPVVDVHAELQPALDDRLRGRDAAHQLVDYLQADAVAGDARVSAEDVAGAHQAVTAFPVGSCITLRDRNAFSSSSAALRRRFSASTFACSPAT